MRRLLLAATILLSCLWADAACTKPTISGTCNSNTTPCVTADANGQGFTITYTTSVASDTNVGWAVGISAGIWLPQSDVTGVTNHSVHITAPLGTATGATVPGRGYAVGILAKPVDAGSICTGQQYWATWAGGDNPTTGSTFSLTAPAGTYDYYLNFEASPKNVMRGYPISLLIVQNDLVGTQGSTFGVKEVATITGPGGNTFAANNMTVDWPLDGGGSHGWFASSSTVTATNETNDTVSKHLLNENGSAQLTIYTNSNTPTGTYTVTVTGSASGGSGYPTHTTTWTFTVFTDNFPYGTPACYTTGSCPAIPCLNSSSKMADGTSACAINWTDNVNNYACRWCPQDQDNSDMTTCRPNNPALIEMITGGVQRKSAYYDGVRIYYQLEDYFKQPGKYAQCVANLHAAYRDGKDWAAIGPGSAIIYFSTGLLMDYQRFKTPASKSLLETFGTKGMVITTYNGQISIRGYQREMAYQLDHDTDIVLEDRLTGSTSTRSLGGITRNVSDWAITDVGFVTGMLDQMCQANTAGYYEVFMVGLQMEALIRYYENVNKDPRIPYYVKCAVDKLWTDDYNALTLDQGTLGYDHWWNQQHYGGPVTGPQTGGYATLNNLVSFAWAWLWKMTGNSTYQVNGDIIWQYGVLQDNATGTGWGIYNTYGLGQLNSNSNGGKQFSESFRTTPWYIKWRSQPPGTKFTTPFTGVAQ